MTKATRPILLFFPKTGPDFLEPPFGLVSLGTALKQAGFDVHIIDARIEDYKQAVQDCIKKGTLPLFCGVSSMTGPQIFHAINISKYIKRAFPEVPVVWGGLHVTLTGTQSIQEPFIDYILRGYSDHTIVQLAEAIMRGETELMGIDGIVYKTPQGIRSSANLPNVDVSLLPEPDWGLVSLPNYVNSLYFQEPTVYMFTSRGCNHSCTFCYSVSVNRRKWQGRSVEQISSELDSLEKLAPFEVVFFHDDNFSVDRARLTGVVDILKRKKKKFVLSANCANIDDELLDLLANSGCVRLDFAIETGSPLILRRYNKGFKIEQALTALEGAAARKIPVNLSFIVGHPEETRKEIFETLDFIDLVKRRWPDVNIIDIKLLTPYPGTPIFKVCEKLGLKAPGSLAEWGEYYWNSRKLIWSPEADLCVDVSFVSLFAFRYNHLHSDFMILRWVYRMLHMIEGWRWRKRFFAFPVELRAMHLALKTYNRLLQYFNYGWL